MGDVYVVQWSELNDRSIFAAIFRRMFRPAEWPWRVGKRYRPWGDRSFDRVVTRYLNTAVRARAWTIAPCYVDVDDLPSTASKSVWCRSWPIGLRWLPVTVVRLWERYALRHMAGTWVADPSDQAYVARFCPCEVFANVALSPRAGYRARGRKKPVFLTVGGLDYPPNAEGVTWFLRNVWPHVRDNAADYTYRVVGKVNKQMPAVDGVVYRGFVDDIDAEYEEAAAVIAPVFSGAGTSVKVLEACARQRAVFAAPFAVRGIPETEWAERGITVCRTAEEMIVALNRFVKDMDRLRDADGQKDPDAACR